MKIKFPLTLQSKASHWRDLTGCIQDALFEAQHDSAGLDGAQPRLTVLVSRNLLSIDRPCDVAAMQALCRQLEQQCVAHSFNCVPVGSTEPSVHTIIIALE